MGYMDDYYTRQAARKTELLTEVKPVLMGKLKAAGVLTAEISYSGYGDSGEMESAELQGEDMQVQLTRDLAKELEDFAYEMLYIERGGWEINEGSSGTCEVDVAAGTVTFEHHTNITDTQYEPFTI